MTLASGGTSRRPRPSSVGFKDCLRSARRSRRPDGVSMPSAIASVAQTIHSVRGHVLLTWTINHATRGVIRRLELQSHLGDEGEDDLCPPHQFERRWSLLQQRMALIGVLPVTEPRYVRVD